MLLDFIVFLVLNLNLHDHSIVRIRIIIALQYGYRISRSQDSL